MMIKHHPHLWEITEEMDKYCGTASILRFSPESYECKMQWQVFWLVPLFDDLPFVPKAFGGESGFGCDQKAIGTYSIGECSGL